MTRTDDLGVPTWLVYAFILLLSFQVGRGLYHAVHTSPATAVGALLP